MTGIIVPLYIYPAPGAWDAVVAAKLAHPSVPIIAVANPNSGVGSSQDQNYVNGINYLKSNGIKVLGYVDTAYGNRDRTAIHNEMASWRLWYGIDGYFFDDVASTGQEQLLGDLKSNAQGLYCVGNPGTSSIPQSYFGILDELCVEGAGLPTVVGMAGLSAICHSIPAFLTPPTGFDYIFETDQVEPNPYGVVSPYMMQMATALDTPVVGEYIVVTAPDLPSVTTSFEIRTLGAVTDSSFGSDAFSLQQNVAGQVADNIGWQNVLEAYPDKLIWKLDVFKDGKLVSLPSITINDLNTAYLRQGFVLVIFSTGWLGGTQFYMRLSTRTVDGIERLLAGRMLPGNQTGHLLSVYGTACGVGGNQVGPTGPVGSKATFDPSLDILVTHSAPVDLTVKRVPQDNPPRFFALEGDNCFQKQVVATPREVQVAIKVGDWMSQV